MWVWVYHVLIQLQQSHNMESHWCNLSFVCFSSAGFVIVVFLIITMQFRFVVVAAGKSQKLYFMHWKCRAHTTTDMTRPTWSLLKLISIAYCWIAPGFGWWHNICGIQICFCLGSSWRKKPQTSQPQLLSYSNYVFDLIT